MRRWRIALIGAGGMLSVLVAASIAVVAVLSSAWFKDQVRLRIIKTIENASGGRVELKSFNYDWQSLTAEVQQLIVHGTEGPGDPPIFRAQQVRVQLRIISLIRRDVDLQELVIERPEIYVAVRADGTTNLPVPRAKRHGADIQDELLKLAIGHFEFRNGVAEVDAKKIALDVRGDSLNADLRYEASPARYLASVSSTQTRIQSKYSLPSAADFKARFQFAKNQIQVDQFAISLLNSRVAGTGTVSQLAHPRAKFKVSGSVDVRQIGQLFKQPILRAGSIRFDGESTYENGAYLLAGSIDGYQVSCGTPKFGVTDGSIRSTVLVNTDGVSLRDVSANAAGASFSGKAELLGFRELEVRGQVSRLNVREVGRFLSKRPLVWDGVASGPVQVRGRFGRAAQDFVVNAKMEILPGSRGIPISGNTELTYEERGNTVRFGETRIALPNTNVVLSGTLGQEVQIAVTSNNLEDVSPVTALFTANGEPVNLPVSIHGGSINFAGTANGPLKSPIIKGRVFGKGVRYAKLPIDNFNSDIEISSDHLAISNADLTQASLELSGSGATALSHWVMEPNSVVHARGTLESSDLATLAGQIGINSRGVLRGRIRLTADLSGTAGNLNGAGTLTGSGLDANGQRIDAVSAQLHLSGDRLSLEQGTIKSADAKATFEGGYQRSAAGWSEGRLDLKVDSDSFRFRDLVSVQAFEPELGGQIEIHARFAALVNRRAVALEAVNGTIVLSNISFRQTPFGDVSIAASTAGRALNARFEGNLRGSHGTGEAHVELGGDYPSRGTFQLSAISFSTVRALIPSLQNRTLPIDGLLEGNGSFNGPLARPAALSASIRLTRLELAPTIESTGLSRTEVNDLTLRSTSPIAIDYREGNAVVQSFRMNAKDTALEGGGRVSIDGSADAASIDFKVNGNLNLQLLRIFNPALSSKGKSQINAAITGPATNPAVNGTLELHDASFYLADLTNGIDHAEGSIRFDRNRATVQKLTAQSGGGNLSVTGFISFGAGTPMIYRLSANAQDVRVRYNGVSVNFDADLKYSGTNQSSILAGNITVTKAAFNPSTDVGSLFEASSVPTATPHAEDGFLHHVRLEVNVQSSSSLQLATSVSQDVQADIDLRLRGTPDRPAVLGRFSVNEGQIQFFGNKYTINRGEVNFFNPLKIEPELDLSLETQARGVTVNITVSGTLDKLNVSYRSDPPLQSSEIIALLATGRAPDVTSSSAGAQTVTQNSALGTGANTILGSAMSPVSSRLERFFGVTHLKIDPMLQGIENVPQARLTLEQQISKQITVTYVTNLSRTSEQIFRFEWALNREYSLVAIRDENGLFGVDVQYKRRFK